MAVNGKWISWSLVQDPNNFNITESGRTPMTKDLVKRLREEIAVFGCPTKRRNPDGPEAADYIEKLEAALLDEIIEAYIRGGIWAFVNGSAFAKYLGKAANDYADARAALGEEEEND